MSPIHNHKIQQEYKYDGSIKQSSFHSFPKLRIKTSFLILRRLIYVMMMFVFYLLILTTNKLTYRSTLVDFAHILIWACLESRLGGCFMGAICELVPQKSWESAAKISVAC